MEVTTGENDETLNILHIVSYKMLHFVTSYMNQNKYYKQTLESADCKLSLNVLNKIVS